MPSENKTPNYGLNQWQGNEYVKREDFVDDNAKIDAALTPTADPAQAPTSNGPFKLVNWVSYFTNRIKAITGLANWWNTPDKSLKDLDDEITTHKADNTKHITSTERSAWNAKETPSGAQTKAEAAANVVQQDLNNHKVEKASITKLGHVKQGKNITINNDGFIDSYDGAWEKISEIVTTNILTEFEFTNINAKYSKFRVVVEGISATSTVRSLTVNFNGDRGANYNSILSSSNGTNPTYSQQNGVNGITIPDIFVSGNWGVDNIAVINIINSKSDTVKKVFVEGMGFANNFIISKSIQMWANWANKTQKINSIQLSSNPNSIGIGSKFTLWGAE